MTPEETTKAVEQAVEKALEVWTLQNLFNISIMVGLLTFALALIQDYWKALEKRLTLRVSIEIWQVLSVLVVDVLLAFVVLVGYLVLNPDIFADIKIGLPFCPLATVLFAAALVLRLFHRGHEIGSRNHLRALNLMCAANLLNIIGFTFVMEAPSKDYLKDHPSLFWDTVKTTLRSDKNLELSQNVFYLCFPLLMAVFLWGGIAALRRFKTGKGE